jgi:hypothetical protein
MGQGEKEKIFHRDSAHFILTNSMENIIIKNPLQESADGRAEGLGQTDYQRGDEHGKGHRKRLRSENRHRHRKN